MGVRAGQAQKRRRDLDDHVDVPRLRVQRQLAGEVVVPLVRVQPKLGNPPAGLVPRRLAGEGQGGKRDGQRHRLGKRGQQGRERA